MRGGIARRKPSSSSVVAFSRAMNAHDTLVARFSVIVRSGEDIAAQPMTHAQQWGELALVFVMV